MTGLWLLLLLLAQLTHSQEQTTTATTTTTTTTTAATTTSQQRTALPRILLNKCCLQGEYLNATTRDCIAGASEMWVPLVFIPQQKKFFKPEGSKPRFMKFQANVRPSCQEPQQQLELFSSRQANGVLLPNGSLSVRELGILVQPASYCVDQDVALVCLDKPSQAVQQEHQLSEQTQLDALSTLRLRKCCGKLGIYDSSIKSCSRQQLAANATNAGQLQLEPQLPAGSYQTSYGLPECAANGSGGFAIAGDWHEASLNRSSGMLHLGYTNLSAQQYCLEHTERAGEVKIIACAHHFGHDHSGNSNSDNNSHSGNESSLQHALLDVGIIISIVFLAATLVAGYMLPAVHHALHWRCQIYYVFCLLVGKILLAIEELSSVPAAGTTSCFLLAIGMQFFFLSAFFWLNTMCFNIWWTFRDFRPSSLERNQEVLRLRLYSAYAWGVPLLICAIAACVDQLPESETSLLRPGFGQNYCWFDNRSLAILTYFFGPIGLLLCVNIVLFISTTHQLTCGLWKRDDVKSMSEKSALDRVCLKLVIVMGVTWIWELISWLVGGPQDIWLLTDLINALQGVFIFIVVGCQPQVWTACRRICCPRLRHDITNTTNGVQHSSSSQGLPSMAGCGTEFTQNTSMNVTTTTTATTPASPSPSPGPGHGLASDEPQLAPALASSEPKPTATKIPMETIC